MSDNSKIVRNSEIIHSSLDDEIIMMSIEKGEYYGLSSIGGRIWELIKEPRMLSDICHKLCEDYNVTPVNCRRDVLDFITHMLEKDLVIIVDE